MGEKTSQLDPKPCQYTTPNFLQVEREIYMALSIFTRLFFFRKSLIHFILFLLLCCGKKKKKTNQEKNQNQFIKRHTVKISWLLAQSREGKWRNITSQASRRRPVTAEQECQCRSAASQGTAGQSRARTCIVLEAALEYDEAGENFCTQLSDSKLPNFRNSPQWNQYSCSKF